MLIELDGRSMTNREATHDHLKEQLELPDHYGRNLDALYDLLCEDSRKRIIRLHHRAEMETMGHYAVALLDVFHDAAEKNPALTVQID